MARIDGAPGLPELLTRAAAASLRCCHTTTTASITACHGVALDLRPRERLREHNQHNEHDPLQTREHGVADRAGGQLFDVQSAYKTRSVHKKTSTHPPRTHKFPRAAPPRQTPRETRTPTRTRTRLSARPSSPPRAPAPAPAGYRTTSSPRGGRRASPGPHVPGTTRRRPGGRCAARDLEKR